MLTKISYICAWLLREDGVSRKIRSQVKALNRYGYAKIIAFQYPWLIRNLVHIKFLKVAWNQTVFQLRGILSFFSSDIIYYRYAPENFLLNVCIGIMPFRRCLVVENNSNNARELRTKGRLAAQFLNFLCEGAVYRKARRVVVFTSELDKYVRRVSKEKALTVIVTNAYDRDWIQDCECKSRNKWQGILSKYKDRYRLAVFVGYPDVWHGIDRMLELIRHNSDWALVLVGPGLKEKYRNLAIELEVENRVAFVGEQSLRDLACIYELCNIGISSFALERKGMQEAAALKVREYVFYGLPVLIGAYDSIKEYCPRVFEMDPFHMNTPLSDIYETLDSKPMEGLEQVTWNWQMKKILNALKI